MVVLSAPQVHINNQQPLKMSSLKSKLQLTLLNRKKARNLLEKGFTLVELMIVVVIVGVLSSVALPNFLAQTSKAKATECTSRLGAILSQVGAEALLSESDATTLAEQLVANSGTENCNFADLTLANKIYTGTVEGAGEIDGKYAASGCVAYETGVRDIGTTTDGSAASSDCTSSSGNGTGTGTV
ncbi:prepilin-type N-terminal cleavage/methylation domain-containing protein [Synechococcus sp. MU1648]|uniref:type IV pilin protein n=1 Tax=Synechococcus sp. MU1648 TaxID=2508351 RepID=UPI002026D6E6|nr:prepilin-type N-terminal cleavage/methylation domain-containing protein [Synechococcus sp. MU1648]